MIKRKNSDFFYWPRGKSECKKRMGRNIYIKEDMKEDS